MELTLQIDTDYSLQEASEIIRSALEHEKHLAKYKIDRYAMICDEFEDRYDLISTELIKKFEAGELLAEEYLEWYAAKRGLDHWKKKLALLRSIRM
ncbi:MULTISPECIES: hypothetical protein [Methanosarcina]|jgi:hypothetical protein|uniref:Uncharacterized protein n=2 Tax=Methanosarcina TaxID=2207 RepID=A0A0E3SNU7_METBA|nr:MULTISPECIES: hypothetical protein [Methanosarcina]AKB83043.1 hypothetical protein MSBR3_2465 [Methanosarcina barkeri 3]MDW5548627.1 hypothetical protein [Methanosarcina sp.]MDW5553908.1 hypothetical protein [Methanosarcina sp.]MDW5558767.1 hypothetical protein [Methanosarcina sp.]PAV13138.1 hypothetical protein ASJ81_18730 [Methanosarcina spelaei]